MVSKSMKGFLSGIVVILVGVFISTGRPRMEVVLISVFTALAAMMVINRHVRGRDKEIFLGGVLIGLVESYHFFIQPNIPNLPDLPGDFQLFIGFLIVTRLVVLALELTDGPLNKPLMRLLDGK